MHRVGGNQFLELAPCCTPLCTCNFVKWPENIKHSTFVQINPGRCLFSHNVHLSVRMHFAGPRKTDSLYLSGWVVFIFQSTENQTSYVWHLGVHRFVSAEFWHIEATLFIWLYWLYEVCIHIMWIKIRYLLSNVMKSSVIHKDIVNWRGQYGQVEDVATCQLSRYCDIKILKY